MHTGKAGLSTSATVNIIITPEVEKRFWVNVNKTEGCWEWIGGKSNGYGMMKINSVSISTHRLSWMIHNGSILDNLWVLHKCDNPPCIRPDHLFLGTLQDNNKDKATKGRSLIGERNANARLTENDVREIRELYNRGGFTCRSLAELYKVTFPHISGIITRRFWRNI